MNLSELIKGESYAFSPLPSIWPNQTSARYCGEVAYEIAARLSNVGASHAAALGYLPPNTPQNPAKLTYRLFMVNNSDLVMADVWINESTLKRVTTGTRTVVISNAAPQDDLRIRSALAEAGFLISSIS